MQFSRFVPWLWENDLAGSGSYARGDRPRSVPDREGPAYAEMVRKQKAYNDRQDALLAQGKKEGDFWSSHPGVAESFIPVWGSAREAIADYREGDIVGAVANGALALTDLTGEGYVAKSLGKGGLKIAGSNGWKATRKWMGHEGKGLLEKGQHGHHWLIPQNGWGKNVPDAIKNQPWNITPMPSAEVHTRMTGAAKSGLPKFNAVERYVYGTPAWWKVQNGVTAAHAANGVQEGLSSSPRSSETRR